jgi:biotin carboxylase/acetyl-CoA carboxylase carboxyltransferase component
MHNILIINKGLCALKFVTQIKDLVCEPLKIFGLVNEIDISSGYKYINYLDEQIYVDDDNIYMNKQEIINICKKFNIHYVFPGWGYLSEDYDFVEMLENNNIGFIGSNSNSMKMLGNKISCQQISKSIGIPVLPFSGEIALSTLDDVYNYCDNNEYPTMIKSPSLGGGRAIYIINNRNEIKSIYNDLMVEIKGKIEFYCTKYIPKARHIEIQVLSDGENAIHLHGRDCTTQRRFQKLVEETPVPNIDLNIIKQMENYAVELCKLTKYRGLATVEFIYDVVSTKFYILEVNCRMQVEVLITEKLFSLNLVKILFLLSINRKIKDIPDLNNIITFPNNRYVVSARINTENPYKNFQISQGHIDIIDIHYPDNCWGYFSINSGGEIIGNVDSQIGHLLAIGETRDIAITRLSNLLNKLTIKTVTTTAVFLSHYINSEDFRKFNHYTKYLEHIECNDLSHNSDDIFPLLFMVYHSYFEFNDLYCKIKEQYNNGHMSSIKHHRITSSFIIYNNIKYEFKYFFKIKFDDNFSMLLVYNNTSYYIKFKKLKDNIIININNQIYKMVHNFLSETFYELYINSNIYHVTFKIEDSIIKSEISGKIVELMFKNGDIVNKGDVYLKLEAMKMVISFSSPFSGIINYCVSTGQFIHMKDKVVEICKESNDDTKYLISDKNIECSLKCEYNTIYQLINEHNHNLNISKSEKNNNTIDISMYPSMITDSFVLFSKPNSGINSWILTINNTNLMLVANNTKIRNGSFGTEESESFYMSLKYARENKIPFIFIANNSGASIEIDDKLKTRINIKMKNNDVEYLYINEEDYEEFKDDITVIPHHDDEKNEHYEITSILNKSLINLDASALIAREMSLARHEIPTFAIVNEKSCGIGAYLNALSSRIIQVNNSSIILTGFNALNKILQSDVYNSNTQIGGVDIMSNNSITHKTADTLEDGFYKLSLWLDYIINPIRKNDMKIMKRIDSFKDIDEIVKSNGIIDSIIDNNSFFETMPSFNSTIKTGRVRIRGKSYSVIFTDNNIGKKIIPIDNADVNSKSIEIVLASKVLTKDGSYKMAKSILDSNIEKLPLLIVSDFRGFSGGTSSMFENILDSGSMIVTNLAKYNQEIIVYIPPNSSVIGGSLVVISKSINNNIKFITSMSAKVSILESSATKQLKFKQKDIDILMNKHGDKNIELYNRAAELYCDLHTPIIGTERVLGKFDNIIDFIMEPSELRDYIGEL